MIELSELQLFCHKIQLVTSHFREHGLTHNKGVNPCILKNHALTLQRLIYHCCIISSIMCHENRLVPAELHEHLQSFSFIRCIGYIGVAYACQLRNMFGNMEAGIYLGVEIVNYLHIFQLDSTYLRKAVISETQTCGLNVENDYLIIEGTVIIAVYDHITLYIVDHICFHAVYDLEILRHIIHTVRECLNITVVCDSHCLMSPCCRSADKSNGIGNSVHS